MKEDASAELANLLGLTLDEIDELKERQRVLVAGLKAKVGRAVERRVKLSKALRAARTTPVGLLRDMSGAIIRIRLDTGELLELEHPEDRQVKLDYDAAGKPSVRQEPAPAPAPSLSPFAGDKGEVKGKKSKALVDPLARLLAAQESLAREMYAATIHGIDRCKKLREEIAWINYVGACKGKTLDLDSSKRVDGAIEKWAEGSEPGSAKDAIAGLLIGHAITAGGDGEALWSAWLDVAEGLVKE